MEIHVKRIDESLPLPKYETPGAVAFDLVCRTKTEIGAGEVALLPSNVVVCVPEGYALLLSSRSSAARKKGLLVPLGIIDQDYCGPGDELFLQVLNFTKETVTVERGERVGQGIFIKIGLAEWKEAASAEDAPNRGGFGTTG